MRFTPRASLALACLLLACANRAPAQVNGYEFLSDWSALPKVKTGMTPVLASSYDRTGGNHDYCYYESPTGDQTGNTVDPVTVVTLTGPGAVTRFWMPHGCANAGFKVRMYADGATTPVLDTDSDTLLEGDFGYMQSPLVSTLVGGQFSYEPILFQDSLIIESNNFHNVRYYYQYNAMTLPAGTTVTPYSGTLTPAQQDARGEVVDMIANVGQNPAGAYPSDVVVTPAGTSIPAFSALTVANLSSSGRIRRLNVKMDGAADDTLDGVHLRVRYDGAAENAIDVPVSHFFGAGHERVAYQSLPIGTDGPDGFYSYWPMPYRDGAVVELYNTTAAPVSIDSAAVEYASGPIESEAGYLHAVYHESTDADHEMLSVEGQGHYVGNILWEQIDSDYRTLLEGDETIVVDGTTVLQGTGLEDAYNGGYYYNHVAVQYDEDPLPYSGIGPYSGLLRMNFDDPEEYDPDDYIRTDQYRWLIGDPVPFTEGINVTMQNYADGEAVFGSTAFYYRLPEPPTLTWTGTLDDTWDIDQTANWSWGSTSRPYHEGDYVVFDDTAAGAPLVTIACTVSPSAVVVDNDTVDVEFAGAGPIAGSCGLTKTGGGTLTVGAPNTYTGGTFINGGTVIAACAGALGDGVVELGHTAGSDDAALRVLGSVTLENAITVQDDGDPSSTRLLGGTGASGTAVFSGDLMIGKDLVLAADPGVQVRLEGALANAGGHTLVKVGGGTVILGGPQTHGLGSVLEVGEGIVVLETDAGGAGPIEDACLSVLVADAELHVGSDQHLDTLTIEDGGLVRFTGAGVVVVKNLVMNGIPLGPTTLTPEPASLALLAVGGLGALLGRRRV